MDDAYIHAHDSAPYIGEESFHLFLSHRVMAAPDSPTRKPSTELSSDAPISTEAFRTSRPEIAGPESPAAPFPLALRGVVQKGFGRGGKDLGCPTGIRILLYFIRHTIICLLIILIILIA